MAVTQEDIDNDGRMWPALLDITLDAMRGRRSLSATVVYLEGFAATLDKRVSELGLEASEALRVSGQ